MRVGARDHAARRRRHRDDPARRCARNGRWRRRQAHRWRRSAACVVVGAAASSRASAAAAKTPVSSAATSPATANCIKPVLAGLPRVVRVNIRTDPSGEWLDNMLRHAVAQAAAATPGSDVIIAHLAEVLFTEVLRRYLLTPARGPHGLARGRGRSGRRPRAGGAASANPRSTGRWICSRTRRASRARR